MHPKQTVKIWGAKLAIAVIAGSVLAGCAETKFVMHTAKRLGETNRSEGNYKVGKPYQVAGNWYYPKEDMRYDKTGIASWYGPNFDGKPTANGEIFDQWEVSAAHKTLPLPSVVRVTNLENGRSLVIRVNDRGPFVNDRIIDLSRRAAQLLGTVKNGTARVRVQVLPEESRVAAQRAKAGGTQLASADAPIKALDVSSQPVATQALPDPMLSKAQSKLYVDPQPVTKTGLIVEPVKQAKPKVQLAALPTRLYIQAGAFSDISNAERVKMHLAPIGEAKVTPISVGGRDLYRVRLGPLADSSEADALLAQVVKAGYANARAVMGMASEIVSAN